MYGAVRKSYPLFLVCLFIVLTLFCRQVNWSAIQANHDIIRVLIASPVQGRIQDFLGRGAHIQSFWQNTCGI